MYTAIGTDLHIEFGTPLQRYHIFHSMFLYPHSSKDLRNVGSIQLNVCKGPIYLASHGNILIFLATEKTRTILPISNEKSLMI